MFSDLRYSSRHAQRPLRTEFRVRGGGVLEYEKIYIEDISSHWLAVVVGFCFGSVPGERFVHEHLSMVSCIVQLAVRPLSGPDRQGTPGQIRSSKNNQNCLRVPESHFELRQFIGPSCTFEVILSSLRYTARPRKFANRISHFNSFAFDQRFHTAGRFTVFNSMWQQTTLGNQNPARSHQTA